MNSASNISTPTQHSQPAPIFREASVFDNGRVLGSIYLVTFVIVAALVAIPLLALVYGSLRSAAPGQLGSGLFVTGQVYSQAVY